MVYEIKTVWVIQLSVHTNNGDVNEVNSQTFVFKTCHEALIAFNKCVSLFDKANNCFFSLQSYDKKTGTACYCSEEDFNDFVFLKRCYFDSSISAVSIINDMFKDSIPEGGK